MPTIGVSVAVPAPFGDELQARRASFGDQLAGSIPTHVTLLPPTEVGEEDVPEVLAHLEVVTSGCGPFSMSLHGTGTFRPVSPVVFVQVSVGLAQCEVLERLIRSGPLKRELEFNYHPHVTVAHHLCDADLDRAFAQLSRYRCTFDVEEVHLYEHGGDGVWRPVRRFTLGGDRAVSGRALR